ncbi:MULTISPECIES: aminoacyl-tRNA deacylase and HDOD domain-containing protein [unclassified Pseudomonas]|uniref:aminoacyl-tRNA deacylase and HDOD domain-containing protein n=1 Tax=unclassified Pseudomonas TaxID=196821 RepID=UPI000BD4C79B|nr:MULTISPECIES: aminoacyl-tRNA deacylase and HDOD domain-containing protein [unclassified Pseudomonas]PVZ15305.1 HD-like signal output (HDOD) protein [Pseudomonas sp. URIL14HWK12:I12]PVZ24679.1 HD-like signal output (HDOD) protein [Pseudomonas sp. URIL14HWK12:I10]PVZ34524.1 HD-like signal output (HDOD) protein [Pseudomonas sp. URIL14HWK12:I11]SNZ08547.1 HD-like signal output (HDOD) domain, no enzymatic activity [Pseudomonas sp. URIL14HWK12:I9]
MTEVALETAVPHAPLVVQQLLDKQAINWREVLDEPTIAERRKVQAILLGDAVGTMVVLLLKDQLLDLNRIAELTGRTLTAVPLDRLRRMLDPHELLELPGLPSLVAAPCLYDERVLDQPSLLIASGTPGVMLEISSEDFKKTLSNGSAARFGESMQGVKLQHDALPRTPAEISTRVQGFTAKRIQQRLEATIEIPPLAKTAQKIIKLRVDPNASVDDITGVVETDPALAAQVVSWAASPYYASPGKVRSVEDAIVRVLGFDLVINLALGLALGKSMNLPKDNPQQATPYWQLSIYTAAVIEGLTRAIPRESRPEAGLTYLAGLLHNFGYLLLAHVFPPHFSLVCRHLEVNPHLNHSYVEQHLLGISREQIGAWLMGYWDMPEELATALRFQNDPTYDGDYAIYANLVCLAVRLLRGRGIGAEAGNEIPQALLDRVGLTREKADDVVNKVLDAEKVLRELATQFG